jgi:hypothetical protein
MSSKLEHLPSDPHTDSSDSDMALDEHGGDEGPASTGSQLGAR